MSLVRPPSRIGIENTLKRHCARRIDHCPRQARTGPKAAAPNSIQRPVFDELPHELVVGDTAHFAIRRGIERDRHGFARTDTKVEVHVGESSAARSAAASLREPRLTHAISGGTTAGSALKPIAGDLGPPINTLRHANTRLSADLARLTQQIADLTAARDRLSTRKLPAVKQSR
jgi:hypothetical protein